MLTNLLIKGSKSRKKVQKLYYELLVPKKLSTNFIETDFEKSRLLKNSLIENFYLDKNFSESEINEHNEALLDRLSDHRIKIIPWLNNTRKLEGTHILEIGCGNGTSTVALAEQGAKVTAIDIDENLLNDAKSRCDIYGQNVSFHLMNATDVNRVLYKEKFDIIIFYAVLEHMTYQERISAIKDTYEMLNEGGLWCVIDTPNRLFYYDSHTSMMPFFHWLPDELAILYSQFSERTAFKNSFNNFNNDEDKIIEFARWGRGMSFHEFELALMPLNNLNIISTLSDFITKRNFLYYIFVRFSKNSKYINFFKTNYPEIHEGFFQPYLNLIIKK